MTAIVSTLPVKDLCQGHGMRQICCKTECSRLISLPCHNCNVSQAKSLYTFYRQQG